MTPVDAHIAWRMRERRKEIGMSLEELAGRVQLTYQQIQKYEVAVNRVSAARLFEIAGCLDVPIDYFFKGLAKK